MQKCSFMRCEVAIIYSAANSKEIILINKTRTERNKIEGNESSRICFLYYTFGDGSAHWPFRLSQN